MDAGESDFHCCCSWLCRSFVYVAAYVVVLVIVDVYVVVMVIVDVYVIIPVYVAVHVVVAVHVHMADDEGDI